MLLELSLQRERMMYSDGPYVLKLNSYEYLNSALFEYWGLNRMLHTDSPIALLK